MKETKQRNGERAKGRLPLMLLLVLMLIIDHASATDIGKGWTAYFSDGAAITQIPNAPLPIKKPAGCTFQFPQNGHINYLTRRAQGGSQKFVQVQLKITGNAKFIPLGGGPLAAAHLYFEEGLLINGWWANWQYSIILQDIANKGVITVKVPLAPEAWGNVQGQPGNYNQSTRDAFARALREMGHAGVTFGGKDGAYGHGVKIKAGNATCTIVGLTFL